MQIKRTVGYCGIFLTFFVFGELFLDKAISSAGVSCLVLKEVSVGVRAFFCRCLWHSAESSQLIFLRAYGRVALFCRCLSVTEEFLCTTIQSNVGLVSVRCALSTCSCC